MADLMETLLQQKSRRPKQIKPEPIEPKPTDGLIFYSGERPPAEPLRGSMYINTGPQASGEIRFFDGEQWMSLGSLSGISTDGISIRGSGIESLLIANNRFEGMRDYDGINLSVPTDATIPFQEYRADIHPW